MTLRLQRFPEGLRRGPVTGPRFFGLSVLAFSLAASAVAEVRPVPFKSYLIDRLSYGVYCADPPLALEEAPGTAAGVVNVVPGLPEFRVETTVVPAEIGIAFGLVVEPRAGVVLDPVTVTITHPPYPDSGVEVEQWITAIEGPSLVGFAFELESELVTGRWSFEGAQGEELLFVIEFDVVPPAMLPALVQGCGGAMLS